MGGGVTRGMLPRALAVAGIACVGMAAGAAPASAAGHVSVRTFDVPVTSPDELGLPVSLDTDVYLPTAPAPPGGRPFVQIYHGGGSSKSNGYDSHYARTFARNGYVSLLYSARGHGASDGQTTAIGPKEIRDLFDVTAWALGIGGRDTPPHADFHIDADRIALVGTSQGGLHTNLGHAYASSPRLNPYGIDLAAFVPTNTPDYVYEALVQEQVIKLTFDVGLIGTYVQGGRVYASPLVFKWAAQLAPDFPPLAGGPGLCDRDPHDTLTSPVKNDLAARSPGCFASRMTGPVHWSQAFDDLLFTSNMAISMVDRLPNPDNTLYLAMGGHGAPAAPPKVEADKLAAQLAFLDLELKGEGAPAPPVTYWTRNPRVEVPGDTYRWPNGSWTKQTATSWPPPGTQTERWFLSAGGRADPNGFGNANLPLAPLAANVTDDPVVAAAMSATPIGTSPIPSRLPRLQAPGLVASFKAPPSLQKQEIDGAPSVRVPWTPLSPDTQLSFKLYLRPAGTDGLTLLSRGVTGIRGAAVGQRRMVRVVGNAISATYHRDDQLVATITASDPTFYKPYVPSLGGVLHAGRDARLRVPIR